MRALVVSLALAIVVVICMTLITLVAGLDLGSAALASIALGLFAVSAIFAAIAALGPKARPTPLLTPTIAGTAAAVVTTAVLIAVSMHLGQGHRSAMRSGEPAKIDVPTPEIAEPNAVVAGPTPEAEAPVAEPVRFPDVTIMPAGPLAGLQPGSGAGAAPDTMAEPSAAAMPEVPLPPSRSAAVSSAAYDSRTSATDAPPERTSLATPTVPIPPIPSPPPARLVLSEDRFDTSNPPPLPSQRSAAASPATTTSTAQATASPPLPRTRPCGADGQPCP